MRYITIARHNDIVEELRKDHDNEIQILRKEIDDMLRKNYILPPEEEECRRPVHKWEKIVEYLKSGKTLTVKQCKEKFDYSGESLKF